MATPRVCAALVLAAVLSLSLPVPSAPAAEPEPRSISIRLNSPDQQQEDEIRLVLTQPTHIEMVDMPLSDAIQYLSDLHNIQILIDHKALEDAGASAETLITFKVENISLESALELMLRDHDLTWMVSNGVLLITSNDRASERLSTRLYPVNDLVQKNAEGVADYKPLIGTIQITIDMVSWDEVGGPGTVSPYAGVLVVSQTEQTHRKLEAFLIAMRKANLLASELSPALDQSSETPTNEPVVTPAE